MSLGALIIRIGFWGPLNYDYNKILYYDYNKILYYDYNKILYYE